MRIFSQRPLAVKILLLFTAAAFLLPLTLCSGQAIEVNPGVSAHHALCPFYSGPYLFSISLAFFAFLFLQNPKLNILPNPFIPERPPRA